MTMSDNNSKQHRQQSTMATDIDAGEQQMRWMTMDDNNDDYGQMKTMSMMDYNGQHNNQIGRMLDNYGQGWMTRQEGG